MSSSGLHHRVDACVLVSANDDDPAETPTSTRAFQIITNSYQGSYAQQYAEILTAARYSVSDDVIAYSEPDGSDPNFIPELTLTEFMNELENAFGCGRWEGHAGTVGVAGPMFAGTTDGKTARDAYYDAWKNHGDWSGKIAKGSGEGFYTIIIYFSAIRGMSAGQKAIVEFTGCKTTNGGIWGGCEFVAASPDTITKSQEAADTNTFWGNLNKGPGDSDKRWAEAAVDDCSKIEMVSGSNGNMQIYPSLVYEYDDNSVIPTGSEGRWFYWSFDGTVNQNQSNPVYVMPPGELAELNWDVSSNGWTTVCARIRRMGNATSGEVFITLQQDCVRSENNNTLRMKSGNTFYAEISDNPAAGFVGGGVVDGVASWDVDWLHDSSHWLVEVDSLGTWVSRASIPSSEHVDGHYELDVGSGFSSYRIVEVDDLGYRSIHLIDTVAPAQKPVADWVGTPRHELNAQYGRLMERVHNAALSRFDTGLSVVVFCPGHHVDEWESMKEFCENYSQFGMDLLIENVDSYPSNPSDFRDHMKGVIADYAEQGVTLFQISGSANWHEQFADDSWWPSDEWLAIRDYYESIGVVGEPELDDVPTWYLPTDNTTDPDYSLEYFYPFNTTDKLYIDLSGPGGVPDGISDPGLYIGRIHAHDDNDLFASLIKVMNETYSGYVIPSYRVGMMVGDLDHLNVGDGQRCLDAATAALDAVPSGHDVAEMFLESDHPSSSERNSSGSAYFSNHHVVAMMASTSWREAPGNNFCLTNYDNPWSMEIMCHQYNHPLVLAGSCNTGDLVRSWRPSIGPDVMYRMLMHPSKGADAWWGNATGTYQFVNASSMAAVLSNVLSNAGLEPMVVSIMDAESSVYGTLSDDGVKSLIGTNFYGFVGHFLIRGDTVADVPDDDLPKVVTVGNYPNPFNPLTKINFSLTTKGVVSLRIYDVSGRLVKDLVQGVHEAGYHSVNWSGRDDAGRRVASGVYMYRLVAENQQFTKKVLMTK